MSSSKQDEAQADPDQREDEMMSNYAAATISISDDRISEMRAKGRQARRECRSRSPSPTTFSKIETKAYVAGWDEEQAHIDACMSVKS